MSAIETVITGRRRDLGGFSVERVLPAPLRRAVGPFVFFDHLTPATLQPGEGMDVRPHPHIGLATVTYLFEGAIDHRDSLGSLQRIAPGEINWMTAGRGIVHSERTPPDVRARGGAQHGLQLWVALPASHEEAEPTFRHYPAGVLPVADVPGVRLRLLAGSAYGLASPVEVLSPLFYVEARLEPGARLPLCAEHAERAAYVVEGTVRCEADALGPGAMVVFTPGSAPWLEAEGPSRVVLLGGAPLDGPRHIWWNFVSSSPARIEQAKADWKEGRFPVVAGDAVERIPLPD